MGKAYTKQRRPKAMTTKKRLRSPLLDWLRLKLRVNDKMARSQARAGHYAEAAHRASLAEAYAFIILHVERSGPDRRNRGDCAEYITEDRGRIRELETALETARDEVTDLRVRLGATAQSPRR